MISFSPENVIRSSELNANFQEHEDRLNILDDTAYASGYIPSGTGVGYKTLTENESNGITKTDGTTYTVDVTGVYFMHFQQLINTTGTATYQMIRINGTTVAQSWQTGSHMEDMVVNYMGTLNAGDTIRLYQSVATAGAWTTPHSSYQIMLVKRS